MTPLRYSEPRRAFGLRTPKGRMPTWWLMATGEVNHQRDYWFTHAVQVGIAGVPGRMVQRGNGTWIVRISSRDYRTAEAWTRETLDCGLAVPVRYIPPEFKSGDMVYFLHNRAIMPWHRQHPTFGAESFLTKKGARPCPGILGSATCRAEVVIKEGWAIPQTQHAVAIVRESRWEQPSLPAGSSSPSTSRSTRSRCSDALVSGGR